MKRINKFEIFGWVLRTSTSLKSIMEKRPRNNTESRMQAFLEGIYSTRKFGLVVYRSKTDYKF